MHDRFAELIAIQQVNHVVHPTHSIEHAIAILQLHELQTCRHT